MRTLKYIFTALTLIFGLSAFAGGSGGGGVMMDKMMARRPEIVFHLGEVDGTVRFAVGKLVENQWQVQNLEVSASSLVDQKDVVSALGESKAKGDWAQIR